ncbi:XrtA/PEP-CTERM system histidine kinase PrsK [Altererythrobacter sp. GH1-8]|uniref:XrtA/PEP-CTERM system histidine kinase PrsK n=1 Tax=Altererythrobacter sp. GH1-8 TaxID=3349333 RepID=UPI00374CD11B
MFGETFLIGLSFAGYFAGAIICAVGAVVVLQRGDRARPDRQAQIANLALLALWSALAATAGAFSAYALVTETSRILVTIWLLLRLFANDGRDESMGLVKPVVAALVFVELLQPLLLLVAIAGDNDAMVFQIAMAMRMLGAMGALVLLHNLYSGAAGSSRLLLRSSAIALACLWAFDLNYHMLAWLGAQPPALLSALRGFAIAMIAIPLTLGASHSATQLEFRPSRKATFQSLSLLIVGFYIVSMLVIAHSLDSVGGDLSRFTQVAFLVVASLAALLWLPSQRLRSWLHVTVAKHLFAHRYDYREEWLRFTKTISRPSDSNATLHERAVKALADITDSNSGLLLAPNEDAQLELVARWQWGTIEVPAIAASYQLAGLLEEHTYILNLDELRAGIDRHGEAQHVPEWLITNNDAWAVVPLLHYDRLVGAVVLARPSTQRPIDWEDLDLLRVAGQQLASYLAEQSGQEALMEASRFDEFNRRIAFVMHDIKNLASQLSLLARNAERHADNPEFRADMLVTLKNSSDKLNALIARLSRYGSGQLAGIEPVDLALLVGKVAERFKHGHAVELVRQDECEVLCDPEALEQALIHLVQNAVDASDAAKPVFLDVTNDGMFGRVEIIDSGKGMTPGFVRNGLFKPFVSSKDGGFGIGAFEARELVRTMGGQMEVESREGLGTRFCVKLPKFNTERLSSTSDPDLQSEVA